MRTGPCLSALVSALVLAGCGSGSNTTTDTSSLTTHAAGTAAATHSQPATGGTGNVTGTPMTLTGAQLCKDFTLAMARTLLPDVEGTGLAATGTNGGQYPACNYRDPANDNTVEAGVAYNEPFASGEEPASENFTPDIPELGEGADCMRLTGESGNTYVYVARGSAQVELKALGGDPSPPSCASAIAKARVLNAAIPR